ncbi:MAG: NIPSNAP family protein, partial [Bryobacteraceae bacterium]
MQRRHFLLSALASTVAGGPQNLNGPGREYYELRRYQLESGPQQKLTNSFVADALIPALNRLGIKPVGVFNLDIGPQTPCLYVLIPSTSVETLVTAELHLAQDDEYLKTGAPFLDAPATQPAYARVESSLMIAFEGRPKLNV